MADQSENLPDGDAGEDEPLLPLASAGIERCDELSQGAQFHTQYRSYGRRWWILAIFCMAATTQSMIWNTFAPLASELKNMTDLDIGDSDIYLFTNWGPIGFILFMPLFTFLISRNRLGVTITFTAVLLIFAGLFRIVPHKTFAEIPRKLLFHVAQFLNGIAGCLPVAAPAHLSSIWFNEEQRGFSTACIFASSWFGTCLCFILGPLMVHNIHTLNVYLYVQLIMALVSALGMLAYFPEAPPTPPSRSAEYQAIAGTNDTYEKFATGFRTLTSGKCKQFWVLLVTTCTVGGIFSTWQAVCYMVFKKWLSEGEAAELGFVTVCAGSLATFIFGAILHKLKGNIKPIMVIVMFTFTLCAGACSLLPLGWFDDMDKHLYPIMGTHVEKVVVWSSSLIFGILLIGSAPIVLEQLADCAFPADENLAGTIAAYTTNVMGLICGQLPIIFNDRAEVMTYSLFGACFLSFVILWIWFEEQNRREEIGIVNDVGTDDDTHSVLSSLSFETRTTDNDSRSI